MSVTNFALAFNDLGETFVTTNYTAGSGKLYVATNFGVSFGSGQWFRISTFRGCTPRSILMVTAIGSDSGGEFLTIGGSAPNEGSAFADTSLAVGDTVRVIWTQGAYTDLTIAINNIEAALMSLGSAGRALFNGAVFNG